MFTPSELTGIARACRALAATLERDSKAHTNTRIAAIADAESKRFAELAAKCERLTKLPTPSA